ncbi:MAG: putative polysaccharide biosynthesis protein [Oscillospiraceae bacterium]|jgi:stage V sporulation protein B
MSKSSSQNYLHGAAILAASVVIIKILGAVYKIPLGNILGDEGYTHFMVAYNIYNVLLTISTAGLPIALSRLISEANTMRRPLQVKRIYRVAMVTFVVLGAIASLAMFLFPTELAAKMGDVEAAQSIWVLSPSVILVCVMSASRGYAEGHSNMVPTSISQVIEVAVKVVFGLVLAFILSRLGKSLPVLAAAAVSGVTVGSLVAAVYIFISVQRQYRPGTLTASDLDVPEPSGVIFTRLIKIGVPIALGASVSSLMTLIDSNLVLNRLQGAAGFTYHDAKVLYGVYAKALTLYNLPAAFVTPLTISIVPAITSTLTAKRRTEAKNITESSLRIATILALPMAVGMCALSYPIMRVLYPTSAEQGPALLAVMGLASFFVCMVLMTTAVLQAYGKERLPVYTLLSGAVLKIILNWVLIGNPNIGIYGAPISTIVCNAFMCVMNYIFIIQKANALISLKNILLRPLISSAVMGVSAYGVYRLVLSILPGSGRLVLAVAMCAGVGVGVVLYLVLTVVTKSITHEDMDLLPGGKKLAKLLRIR